MPEGGCECVGSPCWNRFLAGPVALWRKKPMQEQVFLAGPHEGIILKQAVPEGLHGDLTQERDPVEGTHHGAVHEELQPMGQCTRNPEIYQMLFF